MFLRFLRVLLLLCVVLLRSLTNYLSHYITYDDVAHISHTTAPICNWLCCEKECRLPRVFNPISKFTLASLEHHFITVMLVSKQNIFTDDNLLTHSVLWRSIQPWTFPCFNKIKQKISHNGCFDQSVNHFTVRSNNPTFPVLNKTCTTVWFRGTQYSQNSPVCFISSSRFRFLTIYLFENSKRWKIKR